MRFPVAGDRANCYRHLNQTHIPTVFPTGVTDAWHGRDIHFSMWQPGQFPRNLLFLFVIGRTQRAVRLTPLERRVVRLHSLGCDDRQAAAILGRTVDSIARSKTRALKKSGVHDLAALRRWANGHGISPPDDHLSPSELFMLHPCV